MARRERAAQGRQAGWRWHIPPPLVHGSEPLEGGELLAEGTGPEAVLLWRALRDVMLWSRTPDEDRGRIFATRNAPPTHERPDLDLLLSLAARPVTTPADEVGAACRSLSQRLETEGRMGSALGFAQAAALVAPADALAAFEVARLARQQADHARAEVWYRRAIGLARRARDWRLYSQSFGGLGNLYLLRGNLPAARRLQVRALRGARRGGIRSEQGQALHDLFCVEIAAGRDADAESYAQKAVEAYGGKNPRLTALAHDLAYAWMERGDFARALPVFLESLPLIESPAERLLVRSDVARAAAGAGERARFDTTWTEVVAELDAGRFPGAEPRAWVELAHGATSLADWTRALHAAGRARDAARARGEARVLLTAEALLDAASRRLAAPAPASATPADHCEPASDQLADALIHSLRALRGAAT